MSYFFFSFSKDGNSQGCFSVEADTLDLAVERARGLGIVPDYDDVRSYEIPEPEIPLDELVSPEDMNKLNYQSKKSFVCR